MIDYYVVYRGASKIKNNCCNVSSKCCIVLSFEIEAYSAAGYSELAAAGDRECK